MNEFTMKRYIFIEIFYIKYIQVKEELGFPQFLF